MDHARLRGSNWSAASVALDLGDEPPLSGDGEKTGVDRRRVSVQWFSGTILTGLCGAALMGGAVFAALDGEANFAAVPDRLETALRGSLVGIGERLTAISRKSDRLPSSGEINSARNIIRISTTAKVGDREVVRVRPFVRVSSNLALSLSDLSANVPAFNPQKLMLGDSTPVQTPEQDSAEPNAEVSFVTRDLSPLLGRARIAASVSLDDVIARVRETASFTASAAPAGYPMAPDVQLPGKLAYAAEGKIDPYAGFETRITAENITTLPKTASQAGSATSSNEKLITVKKNENISGILKDLGATPADIKAIAAVLGARGKDNNGLKEGQRLRILISMATGRVQPVRVIVGGDSAVEAVVALSDVGRYVPVDVQSAETQVASSSEDDDEEDDGTGVRLYQSIYETALRNQVPRAVIEDLIRIYSYDVDFQRKTQPGDSFEVLFSGEEENAPAKSDVLFAALNVSGEVKKFYKFVTTDDSAIDYYDETGKSAKKFLVRKPVADGIMRSGFGARHHPILGYTKMHTGIDWAAPMGTPIYASGNGEIEKAGWESGYGKYIRIRHANGYETAYGHMTAFARGMEPGKKVRQGQLIGFVGSTGLSTGAHVHYEILVNGRFVDPMRIKLPRGRALDGPILADFEKERDRLDGMMTKAPARVAGNVAGAGR